MRIDVKKFLFVGLDLEKESFFATMQQLGYTHFIDPYLYHPRELSRDLKPQIVPAGDIKTTQEHPQKILDLIAVIREVQQLPPLDQEEFDNCDGLVAQILSAKNQMEHLSNEKNNLQLEIERIQIFGDFNKEDLCYIEQEGNTKIQFFCAKKGSKAEDSLLYIDSDHGLDYYISVFGSNAGSEFKEMHFDRSLSELKKRFQKATQELEQAKQLFNKYAKYNQYLHQCLTQEYDQFDLKKNTQFSRELLDSSLFFVEGWVPVNKVEEISLALQMVNIEMVEIAIEDQEIPPTYLENQGIPKVGEDLVHIYDTPSSTDKDPSTWVLFAFALFFAMIIGDAGYGLVFLAAALFIRFRLRSNKRFVQLAILLSSVTILWGVLSNSYFGIALDIDHPLRKVSVLHWLTEKKAAYHMQHKDATYEGIAKEHPKVLEATTPQEFLKAAVKGKEGKESYLLLDIFSKSILLEIALLTGIIHISLSFLRYLDRNWSGIGWILALIGGYLYFPYYLKTASILYYVLQIPPGLGAQEGLLLIEIGIGLALFLGLIQKGWYGLLEIPNLIQIFADVVSYVRLYALALASAVMSEIINEAASSVPFVIGVFLILFSHLINMVLGVIGGVIHGLRLNFLEWFHYSFEGGGKQFLPLEAKIRTKK